MDPMLERLIAALLEFLGLSRRNSRGNDGERERERQGGTAEPADDDPIRRPAPVEPQRSGTHSTILELEPGGGSHWATLSSLCAHPTDPTRLFAVPDGDSPPLRIIAIEVKGDRARVVDQTVVDTDGMTDLDVEGSAIKPDGGFWLTSEGKAGNSPPNILLEVDALGHVVRTVDLPPEIAKRMQDQGFEGVSYVAKPSGGAELYVSFQAGIEGDELGVTRIGVVDPATGQWRFYGYRLEEIEDSEYSGLSDILHLGDQRFALIERDGKGKRRALKWITTVDLGSVTGAPPDTTPPVLHKRLAVNLVPQFLDAGRKVEKEIEGLAIAADGEVYAITDNDGDRPTLLLRLGHRDKLFNA